MSKNSNMGRPREFDEEQVLESIMTLFWEKGYEGASLSDIVACTGLKKGSLYAAFGDKRAMYLKGLILYHSRYVEGATKGLMGDGDPRERIYTFLTYPIDAVKDNDYRGCFLCNAAADQASVEPEVGDQVRMGYERMIVGVKQALDDMGMGNNDGLAELIVTAYAGLRIMGRTGFSIEMLEAARDRAMEF